MRSIDEVVAEIRALPTVADIINFLADRGIMGNIQDSEHCPLANYIRQQTGIDNIAISDGAATEQLPACATVDFGWNEETGRKQRRDLCTVANAFIVDFDEGKIPELAYDPEVS